MRVSRIDQDSAAPINPFQRLRDVHPICSKNNDVALGRLLFRASDGAWAKISDKFSQRLRTSGVGCDYGVTGVNQMAARSYPLRYGTYKTQFHD